MIYKDYIRGENNWNDYFFELCDAISRKSKDTSTKVGAVLVNYGNSIISTGYNGFPIGVDDSIESRFDRPEKYTWTCHAEENAIAFAARNGISTNGAKLYCNRLPCCAKCTRLAIQAGIAKLIILCDVPQETIDRWKGENDIALSMIKESGASIEIYIKNKEKTMSKNETKIANQIAKIVEIPDSTDEFDFIKNNDCGPDNMIEVAKSEVYAHQITEEDVKKIQDLTSREGGYDDSYKVPGNFICTAKVSVDAGEFWIVKTDRFPKNYEDTVCDDEMLTKKVCGADFKFGHYRARSDKTFECFRLPADAPKEMTFEGQKFVPGDYVFIEDGKCSEWARSDKFMQQQYHRVGNGKKPEKSIYDQYEGIIGSGK